MPSESFRNYSEHTSNRSISSRNVREEDSESAAFSRAAAIRKIRIAASNGKPADFPEGVDFFALVPEESANAEGEESSIVTTAIRDPKYDNAFS